ncbi:hypothetical protein Hanom_Chr14g01278781 [Helianthus anomalus]
MVVVDGITTPRAPSYTAGEDDRSPTLVWRSSGGGKPELRLGLQAPTLVDPSTEVITVSVCKCFGFSSIVGFVAGRRSCCRKTEPRRISCRSVYVVEEIGLEGGRTCFFNFSYLLVN